MSNWQSILKYDPTPPLESSASAAVKFFANRDLAGEKDGRVEALWDLPGARKIIGKQQPDGSWRPTGSLAAYRSADSYAQTETFRNLGYLVEMYGFNRDSLAVARAAEFLLGFQTAAGDLRGILGRQYSPYYLGATLELLIKAGYADDPRVTRAFEWLESARQDDGGWAIPLRTRGRNLDVIAGDEAALEPDKTKPSSHLATGMVLRAYAALPRRRQSAVARRAGELLLSRLFAADRYADRRAASFWLQFTFPFWFTDLISALDSLSLIGVAPADPQMIRAINWLVDRQQPDGLWKLRTTKNTGYDSNEWLSLAICRILKRLYP
jgi:hypothetical protein